MQEVISLSSQLAYTYSANRQASFPFSLICTSLNGRLHDRLESLGDASYKRWSSTEWSSESYESLWSPQVDASRSDGSSSIPEASPSRPPEPVEKEGSSLVPCAATEATPTLQNDVPRFPKPSFVYLTADTEDELTELRPDETYIIGGIVDHNRYKVGRPFRSEVHVF